MIVKKNGNTSCFGRSDKVTVDAFLEALRPESIMTGAVIKELTATGTEVRIPFENRTPAEIKSILTGLNGIYLDLDIVELK